MGVKNYAVLEGSRVVNSILLDDDSSEYHLPEGLVLKEAPEQVSIGWSWMLDDWVEPTPPPMPDIPIEDPTVTEARWSALTELTDLGVSKKNARIIVGLPPEDASPTP